MAKSERLEAKIAKNKKKQIALHNEGIRLEFSRHLLPEKGVKFWEDERTIGRGKNKKTLVYMFRSWPEDFVDEDTGQVVTIERNRIVKIDGIQVDEFQRPITKFLIAE